MGFLEKIEILINHYLILLSELVKKLIVKCTPPFLKTAYQKTMSFFGKCIYYIKVTPYKFMTSVKVRIVGNKEKIKKFPIKEKIAAWRIVLQEELQKKKHKGVFNKIIPIVFVPLNALLKWMDNLSPVQAVLLIVFTVASFFSSFLVVESIKKIALFEEAANRRPASVEDEKIQRPYYYKRQTRDFNIMAIKIPVYFADLNEYRSVMVDFSIILTNRSSKNYLAENEQILRDHIIMNVEPTIAAFNLQNEGKEIIRQKIKLEVSEFLKEKKVEGDVEEVKITYILAN